MPVKNWSFGANVPSEGLCLLERQIELAHQYRNKLVELELLRRQEDRQFCETHEPQVLHFQEEELQRAALVDLAVNAIRQINANTRRRAAPAPLRNALRQARLDLRETRAALKLARQTARENPEAQTAREANSQAHYQRYRDARAEFSGQGLYWGSYLQVEEAAASFHCGSPPEFRRWRDGIPTGFVREYDPVQRGDICNTFGRVVYTQEGKVSVQIQLGISWDEALACQGTCFRLEMVERKSHPSRPAIPGSKRSERVKSAIAWVRVGSDAKRKPVWVKVPVVIHRRPDKNAKIKWVHLLRTFAGMHPHWKMLISVQEDDVMEVRPLCNRVAVNPGWRVVEGGLRVATWADDAGNSGHLVLPSHVLDRWPHADSLRGIADRNFDEIRDAMVAYLATLPETEGSAWLRALRPHMCHWRSRSWMHGVAHQWRHCRFVGDGEMFARLEKWRVQDKHLADWEGGARQRLARWRQWVYRNLASQLRATHSDVVLGLTGQWKSLAKLPLAEDTDPIVAAWRYNQRIASPGLLEQTLASCGMRCSRVDACFATMDCHVCGSREQFDTVSEVVHTCSRCEEVWDQDINHCKNLLARARAVEGLPGTARDPEGGAG